MKSRKAISLLLLAVYLFAAGGVAVASLSCRCIAEKPHAVHSCCHHIDHQGDAPAARADLSAPCCNDHHSTEIDLYTGSASANDRAVKCTVLSLPPSLAAECPCPAHLPVLREKTAERQAPFVPDPCLVAVGFRAPPVLA